MQARRSPRRAPRRALSLIELVMVMLIVAILTAVAAPKYQHALAVQRVNAAAGRVAADLRMVRAYARKTSTTQSIQFSTGVDTYYATGMPDMNGRNSSYTVNIRSLDYVTDITAVNFGGSFTVQFDMYGRPNYAGTIVLQAGGQQRTVQVDEAGHVSIL